MHRGQASGFAVDPRACGVNVHTAIPARVEKGRSPRMRGKLD